MYIHQDKMLAIPNVKIGFALIPHIKHGQLFRSGRFRKAATVVL